jgi:phosphocarrier protein HPr
MASIACKVINQKGMHARAAAKIVALICQYNSETILTHKKISAPGNSLLKLLTLNAPKGSTITIEANGSDCDDLLNQLSNLFAAGFGE